MFTDAQLASDSFDRLLLLQGEIYPCEVNCP
jgi:hypothetical protein